MKSSMEAGSTPVSYEGQRFSQRSRHPWFCGLYLSWAILPVLPAIPVQALPLPDTIPEEVLRQEVITEARSPIDGQPLPPAEYTALQAELRDPREDPPLPNELQELIFLLQLRQGLRQFIPFLP